MFAAGANFSRGCRASTGVQEVLASLALRSSCSYCRPQACLELAGQACAWLGAAGGGGAVDLAATRARGRTPAPAADRGNGGRIAAMMEQFKAAKDTAAGIFIAWTPATHLLLRDHVTAHLVSGCVHKYVSGTYQP
jgi:hypothetical protein